MDWSIGADPKVDRLTYEEQPLSEMFNDSPDSNTICALFVKDEGFGTRFKQDNVNTRSKL